MGCVCKDQRFLLTEIIQSRNRLNWGEESTWSYQSGNLVEIAGYITVGEEWQLESPGGIMICLKPSQVDIAEHSNSSLHNEFRDVQGRLMWSEADSSWCVDSSEGTPLAI